MLVALALDAAPRADARAPRRRPRYAARRAADVDDLRDIIETPGAREQVEAVIGELADRAVASLGRPTSTREPAACSTELAAAATQRAV